MTSKTVVRDKRCATCQFWMGQRKAFPGHGNVEIYDDYANGLKKAECTSGKDFDGKE